MDIFQSEEDNEKNEENQEQDQNNQSNDNQNKDNEEIKDEEKGQETQAALDDDYNIDENKIEAAITKKTKAIMPVIWAGRPCELDKIKKIANKYKLKLK